MKKTVLRYGIYSALFEFIAFVLVWLLLTLVHVNLDVQGTLGWVCIVCPLVFVYFGIRYYRDQENDGALTFMKALQIGLLMILIPAVAYAIIETVYVEYLNPKFYETIASYQIAEFRKTLSPADLAVKLKEIKQELSINANPLYNFSMMVLIIYALGTIVTVLSSLLLMRRVKKEAV